jgi:hypothetical protein
MRAKVKRIAPVQALTRILEALGQELIDATDEEILAAARELRMDPTRKHSAAFAGLTYFARPQLSDFFDLEAHAKLQGPAEQATMAPLGADTLASPRRKSGRLKRVKISPHRKDDTDK